MKANHYGRITLANYQFNATHDVINTPPKLIENEFDILDTCKPTALLPVVAGDATWNEPPPYNVIIEPLDPAGADVIPLH